MEKSFTLTLKVVWWMQLIQTLLALFFTIPSISALVSFFNGEQSSLATLFTFFFCAFLAYFCWANVLSTIQITNESVTVTVFYGRFRIHWNEVEKIVLNSPIIALIGNNKRVVLSLEPWGKSGKKMLDLFNQQIEMRNIVFEQNSPFPIKHQNTRVWR